MEKNEIRDIANILLSQVQPKATIARLEQITDAELDKTYDVYFVNTQQGDKYIMKHTPDGYEALIYSEVFAKYSLPIPEYLGQAKDLRGDSWFLCEYVNGEDIRIADLSIYNLAIKQLAQIHYTFWCAKQDRYSFVKNENVYLEKLASLCEKYKLEWQLHKNILSAINIAANRLINRPQTIIHNDLLPINIFADNDEVRFIDWGNTALGCYAHDLGRLLGDLKNENVDYWIKSDWRQSILYTYYEAINGFGNMVLSWNDLQFDFQCAQFCNYASIVLAHLKNSWPLSQWYQVNLAALIDIANRIIPEDSGMFQ